MDVGSDKVSVSWETSVASQWLICCRMLIASPVLPCWTVCEWITCTVCMHAYLVPQRWAEITCRPSVSVPGEQSRYFLCDRQWIFVNNLYTQLVENSLVDESRICSFCLAVAQSRCRIMPSSLGTNRKSHMSFQLVPNLMTLKPRKVFFAIFSNLCQLLRHSSALFCSHCLLLVDSKHMKEI